MPVKCLACGQIMEEGSGEPLYECACGTIFNRTQTGSHQCPDCSKFASKLADDSCSECEGGEIEDVTADYCEECDEWYELLFEDGKEVPHQHTEVKAAPALVADQTESEAQELQKAIEIVAHRLAEA